MTVPGLDGRRDRATSSRSSRRRKAARGDIPGGLEFQGRRGSSLLRSLLRRAVAPFRHELIEFRLVLGLAQACQEVPELALLVLQALERIGAVFVEGTVAAGTVAAPPVATAAQALHLVLETPHLTLPAIVVIPATHPSSPDDECEDHEADRPPHHEAEDHEKDPGWSP